MAEYVTEKPTTVCKACAFYTVDPEWHNPERCAAPDAGAWNPVNGDRIVILWGTTQGPPYACLLINDGDCPHFEAKGTP